MSYIFFVYLGSMICYTNASRQDEPRKPWEPKESWPTGTMYRYPCKFPFHYQGKEYNNKCVQENKYSYFCAIDNLKESHGFECPNCWPNETYRIGYCEHGDQCGIGEYLIFYPYENFILAPLCIHSKF